MTAPVALGEDDDVGASPVADADGLGAALAAVSSSRRARPTIPATPPTASAPATTAPPRSAWRRVSSAASSGRERLRIAASAATVLGRLNPYAIHATA